MKRVWRRPSVQSDRGAYAVLYAILAVAIVGFAALALDIGMQLYRQQNLQNVIDAAVVAGSQQLDGRTVNNLGPVPRARIAVTESVTANDPTLVDQADPTFYCVVASTRGVVDGVSKWVVDTDQVGETKVCYPGLEAAPYSMAQCNSRQCAIPCLDEELCKPNTIRLGMESDVPYVFAPVIGIAQGSTGGVVSVACKGGCGAQSGAPVDMVIIGDRTPSMSQQERLDEAEAITLALGQLEPTKDHVALGLVGYSNPRTGCALRPGTARLTQSSPTIGQWIPIPLPESPFTGYGFTEITTQLNDTSCFTTSNDNGTHLASPLLAAAKYLDNPSVSSRGGELQEQSQKAIIFETDGQPCELLDNSAFGSVASDPLGSTFGNVAAAGGSRGESGVPSACGANRNVYAADSAACTNLERVATAADDAGILVAFVKYANEPGACPLENYASPHPVTDEPMIYYAATSTDFTEAFADAIGAIQSGARLMQFPAPGDDLLDLTNP